LYADVKAKVTSRQAEALLGEEIKERGEHEENCDRTREYTASEAGDGAVVLRILPFATDAGRTTTRSKKRRSAAARERPRRSATVTVSIGPMANVVGNRKTQAV